MPKTSKRKTAVAANLALIESILERMITESRITPESAGTISGMLYDIIASFADRNLDNSTNYKKITTLSQEMNRLRSKFEPHLEGGVPVRQGAVVENAAEPFAIEKSRAYIFLVCTACSGVGMIEFISRVSGEIAKKFMFIPKNSIMYMTCTDCISNTASAGVSLSKHDWARKNLFVDGFIVRPTVERVALIRHVKTTLGLELAEYKMRGMSVYLTNNTINEAIADGNRYVRTAINLDDSTIRH